MQSSKVLFQDALIPISLPVCDHYAGSEKLMRKSMALQYEYSTQLIAQRMDQRNNPRAAFDITFDCEDGAAVGDEQNQAQCILELLESAENRFNRIGARVHPPSSEYFSHDIKTICTSSQLAYVVIPKITSTAELQDAIKAIHLHRNFSGLTTLPIHALIETHGALAEVQSIASLKEVECLSFGIMDFVSTHNGYIPAAAMCSPEQFIHPLVMRAKLNIAAACHLYGKVASHNVTTEFKDTMMVALDAEHALRKCSFHRMWSIHPNQIQPIIHAFSPNLEEQQEAIAILTAAQNANWGPIQMSGRLYDRASYRYYWAILKRAQATGLALSEEALKLTH